VIPSTNSRTPAAGRRSLSRRVRPAFATAFLLSLCLASSSCSFGKDDDDLPQTVTPELARANEVAGQYERSAAIWHRLHLQSGGEELDPYLGCGRSLLATGDVKSACAIVEQGLQVFPRDMDLRLLHGKILEAANYSRAAERCYEQAVLLDPNNHEARLGLGRIRVRLGLERRAIEHLRAANELEPGDVETLQNLALAAERTGCELEAYEAHRQLLELEDLHGAYRYVSASRLAFVADVQTAHPDALVVALPWIEEAIRLDPQSSEAHFLRARHFELHGALGDAELSYLRAVEIDPGNLGALEELAENYHEAGTADQADRFARMALTLERNRQRRVRLETYLIVTD